MKTLSLCSLWLSTPIVTRMSNFLRNLQLYSSRNMHTKCVIRKLRKRTVFFYWQDIHHCANNETVSLVQSKLNISPLLWIN